jgi:hypothetical protein
VGSTNTVIIDNSDDDGFWVIKDIDTHVHIDYFELDPEMSNSDIELDVDDKASYAELAGMKDEQALDWFGSDN